MANPAIELQSLFRKFFESVKEKKVEEAKLEAVKLREILESLPESFNLDEVPDDLLISTAILHHPRSKLLLEELITGLEASLQ